MVNEILIPVYNHQKDFKKLSNIYNKLSESFSKISSQVRVCSISQHEYVFIHIIFIVDLVVFVVFTKCC